MAELPQNAPAAQGGHAKYRNASISTKMDMTPMVDLGFLLITFFMLTTSLQNPTQINLNMPKPGPKTSSISEKNALVLIPGPHNRVYYFSGSISSKVRFHQVGFGPKELRQLIVTKKREVLQRAGHDSFTVLIMPMDKASYANVIDIIDELSITDSQRYALMDMDQNLLKQLEKTEIFLQ